ncbi:MAG TPA: ABC-F family ATP-binding cassette domain-containing protein [Symbiobacteriaceae bacterium]|jgi:ATP-binding cassette subfamily F protein uup
MNILTVENLAKTYGEKLLFDKLSIGIAEGERIGLIGLNGSGKSTLLKVVARLITPDAGTVTVRQGLRIQYLAQNPDFPPGATVLEAVFAGESPAFRLLREYEQALFDLGETPDDERLQRRLAGLQLQMDAQQLWSMEAQAKATLSRLGVTEYTRLVETLSGGQRKRVALAQALIHPADLLILDEPTNHIDNVTVAWLEGQLAKFSGALLLVTHDRYFLDRVVTRILELDHARLYSYDGNYGRFLEQKEVREAEGVVREERRQNLLRRELAWLRRGAQARSTKQKARIDRVHSLQEQVPDAQDGSVEIAVGSRRLGRQIITLKDLSHGFDGQTLFRDFSYTLLPKDRIGIVGPNGSGKTTLLKLIAGRLTPDQGEVATGQTVHLVYYDQESEEMDPNQRVIDYIKDVAEVVQTPDGGTITAAQMLERFLFPMKTQWTEIGKLSGGERRRLYLLRRLMAEPNVLLLDEPTNDLDIETLTILEDYLDQFPGVVVAVSHDRYFLDRVAGHLFCFEGDGHIRRYVGTCSEYLAEQAEAGPADTTPGKAEQPDGRPQPEKRNQALKLSFKEQREWETIEERVAGLEVEVARLERALDEAASDYARLQVLAAEHTRAQAELGQAMDRWAELATKVEAVEQERANRS